MTLRNDYVAECFVNGIQAKNRSLIASHNGYDKLNVIYSWGTHFPIAVRVQEGYLFNEEKYSSSTTRHQNLVKQTIGEHNILKTYKNAYELSTFLLKLDDICYKRKCFLDEISFTEIVLMHI